LRGVAPSHRAMARVDDGYAIYPHVFHQTRLTSCLETLLGDGIARSKPCRRRFLESRVWRDAWRTIQRLLSRAPTIQRRAVHSRGPPHDPLRQSATAKAGGLHQIRRCPLRGRFDDAMGP
jgi:hypothetical protein